MEPDDALGEHQGGARAEDYSARPHLGQTNARPRRHSCFRVPSLYIPDKVLNLSDLKIGRL